MKGIFSSLLGLLSLTIAAAASPREELVALADKHGGHIPLTPATFNLLTSNNRDWSATVHLTANSPKRNCNPCKMFGPSFDTVAKAWRKVSRKERETHFFGTLDFDDEGAMPIFQKLQLQSAPAVYVYGKGNSSPTKYDFNRGFEPKHLAEELSKQTPVPIPYTDPVDYTKYVFSTFAALAFIAFLRYLRPIITSKYFWGSLTIISSIIFTSGLMFTRIRGVPWVGPNGSWIASGYQNQYGQEVQVMSLVYAFLSFAVLMQILVIPRQTDPTKQRIQVYIWTAVTVVVYSVLVAIFKVKHRGYPFKLLW